MNYECWNWDSNLQKKRRQWNKSLHGMRSFLAMTPSRRWLAYLPDISKIITLILHDNYSCCCYRTLFYACSSSHSSHFCAEGENGGQWGEILKVPACSCSLEPHFLHIGGSPVSTSLWSALHKPIQSNLAREEKSIKFPVIGLTVHSKAEQQSILKMKNEAKGHLTPLICSERRRNRDIIAT